MFKWIIFGIILYIIYIVFFKKENLLSKVKEAAKKTDKKKRDKEESEVMVECSKCGIFISSKEAVIKDGKYYCSKECAGVK
ncbi:MAG: hypothetical protein GXO31_00280 [Epsilonproteobacteria bacterium]|nr:hypothetical protein [Campylobacterota bacterium]